jgi:hypothetical protein
MTRVVGSVERGEDIRDYFLYSQGLKHHNKGVMCVKVKIKDQFIHVRTINAYRGVGV